MPVLPGAIGWIVGAESPPSDLPGMERVAVGVTAPAGPSVARRVPVRGARELAVGLEVAGAGSPGPHLAAHIRWSAAFDSDRRRAVCKTVGSAYVGSNPTPATTCEDGPLAGISRLCGPFFLCLMLCHFVAL